ncbi:MAG: protein O-GlcNAc transferase [Pyrinomonadaceae bacterium]|jgi:tetratricopeptide (TPR) repeat protein|nr:protein O-GlcNAc transferase [Pyrinomonadaceae bacterium]
MLKLHRKIISVGATRFVPILALGILLLVANTAAFAQNVSLAERPRNPRTGCRQHSNHNHAEPAPKRTPTNLLQDSTKDSSFEVEVYLFLGNKARDAGQSAEATRNYNYVLWKLDGKEWRAHYGLGNVLFDEAFLPANPTQPLGRAHATMNKAIAEYQEAVKLSSPIKQDEREEVSELYSDLAQAYLHTENESLALTWANRALQLYPNSASATRRVGNVYFSTDKARAIEKYKESLKLEPNNALTHRALGAAYFLLNQNDLAVKQFKEVIGLRPDYLVGYQDLARALVASGQFSEAAGTYETAIKLKPSEITVRYELALTYLQMQDTESAKRQYVILKGLNGVDPAILSELKQKLNMP